MKSILKIEHTNGLWLKPLEWAAVLCITIAVLWLALPRWHARRLQIELPKDFRLSYKLRDDYLLYRSVAAKVVETHPALFIGDSVVWGMYVRNDHTLPAIRCHKQFPEVPESVHCNFLLSYQAGLR